MADSEAPNEARPALVLHVSEIERENQLQEAGTYRMTVII